MNVLSLSCNTLLHEQLFYTKKYCHMSEIYGLKTFKDFYIFDLSLICLVIEDSSSLIFYFKEAELRAIGNLGCQSSKKKNEKKWLCAYIAFL